MPTYIEQANGSLTEGGRSIPNDPANRDYANALQEVIDLESTITAYAGSALELGEKISNKVAELQAEFFSRHGVTVTDALALAAFFNPITPATGASTAFHADIAIAQAAKTAIEGFGDAATVDAYNVVSDPGWT